MKKPLSTRKSRRTAGAIVVVASLLFNFFAILNVANDGGSKSALGGRGHGSCRSKPNGPHCTTTTTSGPTTTTSPPPSGTPATPADTNAEICDNDAVLDGPGSAPGGATTISAATFSLSATSGTLGSPHIYYFTAGVHHLEDPATPLYSGTGNITAGSQTITGLSPATTSFATDGSATVSGVAGGSYTNGSGNVFIGARITGKSANTITTATTPNASKTGVSIKVYNTYTQMAIADYVTLTGAPGAIIDGLGANASAVVGPNADNGVTIEHLTFQNFATVGDQGGVNPDGAGHNWTIRYNTFQGFGGSAVMLGTGDTLTQNCLRNNSQYGFSVYENISGASPPTGDLGPSDVTVTQNEVTNNNVDRIETRDACGPSAVDIPCANGNFGGAKIWQAVDPTVNSNYVHDNFYTGIWFDSDNVGTQFNANYVANNTGIGLWYEVSYNAQILNNNFVENDFLKGPANSGFPEGAMYISESGGETRGKAGTRGTRHYTTIDIGENAFNNNWGNAVGLWESSDRFCGNGETLYCTLDNNAIPNNNAGPCFSQTTVQTTPYKDDCRWKTQNITVHDNDFNIDKSVVDAGIVSLGGAANTCTNDPLCGTNAVFSQGGSYPCWNPYGAPGAAALPCVNVGDGKTHGTDQFQIADKLMPLTGSGTRNLHFSDNTYVGDWNFVPHDPGVLKTFDQWQASPFSQDAGSTCTCSGGARALPNSFYGVTFDNEDFASPTQLTDQINSLTGLAPAGKLPIIRIVFNPPDNPAASQADMETEALATYGDAIAALKPHAYIMGELLDSEEIKNISIAQYSTRARAYLNVFGDDVDLWEVGNEVNGNWTYVHATESYTTVATKITNALNIFEAAGKKTELTLWENSFGPPPPTGDGHCGNGAAELSAQVFSNTKLTPATRAALDYVTVSWYPSICAGIPNDGTSVNVSAISSEMQGLHSLYQNARLGFGELGLPNAGDNLTTRTMSSYYYNLNLNLPYYMGGYFWWYFAQNGVPKDETTDALGASIWTRIHNGMATY